jgi:dihydrofolate reductase
MGSANLSATLIEHRLIDEYRIAINPVILGAGAPLFAPGATRTDHERTDVRLFMSGIVEIRLRPPTITAT